MWNTWLWSKYTRIANNLLYIHFYLPSVADCSYCSFRKILQIKKYSKSGEVVFFYVGARSSYPFISFSGWGSDCATVAIFEIKWVNLCECVCVCMCDEWDADGRWVRFERNGWEKCVNVGKWTCGRQIRPRVEKRRKTRNRRRRRDKERDSGRECERDKIRICGKKKSLWRDKFLGSKFCTYSFAKPSKLKHKFAK